MGVWAEFEEKEFETLANAALIIEQARSGRGVRLFSPGQALEKILGYDFATRIDPRSSLYRRLFGAAPGAVGASAAAQVANQIPVSKATRLLNVFLQYKRPQYFAVGHRSKVWSSNRAHLAFQVREQNPDPALRFDQIRALRKLQIDLGRDARISYACPSTWQKQELYDRFYRGSLLRSTIFVGPDQLIQAGDPGFHIRWTFDPANIRRGIPNPDGQESDVLDGEAFLDEVATETTQSQVPRATDDVMFEAAEHTKDLRDDLDELRASRPRRTREAYAAEDREVDRELAGFSGHERELIKATTDVALLARDIRATWSVAMDA
ncbi:hypothetical protein [Leifsonia sp. A12D58]|uniref:hypothetical protein n=1 Tax=Leifsonia sp. A12D58 TaxID=3397674 RepID=UPI0039E09066